MAQSPGRDVQADRAGVMTWYDVLQFGPLLGAAVTVLCVIWMRRIESRIQALKQQVIDERRVLDAAVAILDRRAHDFGRAMVYERAGMLDEAIEILRPYAEAE